MLHEIHAVRFFTLTAVARLESQRKIGLQLLGQRLTAGRFRVEDLCAVVLALGEEVLVYAQKQRILRLVYRLGPVFDVRNFFLRDRAAAV